MHKIFLLVFVFLSLSASGQQESCYDLFLSAGIAAYDRLQFEKCIEQFKAAELCPDRPGNTEVDDWLQKARNGYLDHTLAALRIADSLRVELEATNENLKEALASKLGSLNQIAFALRELKFKYDLGKEVDELRSVVYGNLSWNMILNHNYKDAIIAARQGLRLSDTNHWINANLVIAYALYDELENAEKIALQSKDLPYKEVTVKEVILGDILQLGEYGITSPKLEVIEQLLRE